MNQETVCATYPQALKRRQIRFSLMKQTNIQDLAVNRQPAGEL
jgi:hypothetical protein